jgi:hypothetical protein
VSNIYLDRLRAISGTPVVQELPKVSKAAFGSFGSAHTSRIPENEATHKLSALLRQHGGFAGVDWHGIDLIDAEHSSLWVVQRPDGLLTVLATVDPISKPLSYAAAWPSGFTSPEPADAAPVARAVINRARKP